MGICLICGEATSVPNGLCLECGKRWNDSVSRKVAETCTKLQLTDKIDQLAMEYESGSANFKVSVVDFISRVNIIECFNKFYGYLREKSEKTYLLFVQVLVNVLENHPFPRVVMLHLADCQQTTRIVQQSSDPIRAMIADYTLELEKELKKTLSKKQVALKLKRKHRQLRIEMLILMIVTVVSFITALFLYIAGSSTIPVLTLLGVVPATVFIVLKVSRYNSIDMNLKIKPHICYQIDLLDIPDSYIANLQSQISRLSELEPAS
jgi:hypothetical protein